MSQLFVKIRFRGNGNKYRKLLSTDKCIYSMSRELIQSSITYHPQTLLGEGEWYFIKDFSQSKYTIDILSDQFETVDFDILSAKDINKIDYIFVEEQNRLYFQNISKSRLVRKKAIIHIGEEFKYDESFMTIVLNEIPDAVYARKIDTLYFQKLASITGIFKGIDQLYREATEDETKEFLKENFITLKNNFSSQYVKTTNRKKIALVKDTFLSLPKIEREQVFSYIREYCPNLKSTDDSFEVGNEEDLKMLLLGIEQRFYTTPIGKEKRIANSVIVLEG